MREKIIRGLISSIIVVLLLGFEYKLSFNIVHDFESRNTSYAIEDFYQINDYDVDGDKLVPTSADPQLILNFDGSWSLPLQPLPPCMQMIRKSKKSILYVMKSKNC